MVVFIFEAGKDITSSRVNEVVPLLTPSQAATVKRCFDTVRATQRLRKHQRPDVRELFTLPPVDYLEADSPKVSPQPSVVSLLIILLTFLVFVVTCISCDISYIEPAI